MNSCSFLILTIITNQRQFFRWFPYRFPKTERGSEHVFICKIRKLFFFILHLSVFIQFYLITNKARKMNVVESNPFVEIDPSSLSVSLSLSVGWGFYLSLSSSRFISLALSLFLSFTLSSMPHFSCCYLAWCHLLPSLKLNYSKNVLL